jgi:hypothetical protein
MRAEHQPRRGVVGARLPGPAASNVLGDNTMAKLLEDLFLDTLKDIYFAEQKIVATLPEMEQAAS